MCQYKYRSLLLSVTCACIYGHNNYVMVMDFGQSGYFLDWPNYDDCVLNFGMFRLSHYRLKQIEKVVDKFPHILDRIYCTTEDSHIQSYIFSRHSKFLCGNSIRFSYQKLQISGTDQTFNWSKPIVVFARTNPCNSTGGWRKQRGGASLKNDRMVIHIMLRELARGYHTATTPPNPNVQRTRFTFQREARREQKIWWGVARIFRNRLGVK